MIDTKRFIGMPDERFAGAAGIRIEVVLKEWTKSNVIRERFIGMPDERFAGAAGIRIEVVVKEWTKSNVIRER
ncbi:unnamed protein product [Strongylus vulgaris]|uniref:Uncharacterized protein n=1 Tax=Strongylus vulgaris TaxID=40348 RepID=A0A3P7JI09_STRVU|nr:unnamed protein product [Strongylus vulgaris]